MLNNKMLTDLTNLFSPNIIFSKILEGITRIMEDSYKLTMQNLKLNLPLKFFVINLVALKTVASIILGTSVRLHYIIFYTV